MAFRLFSLLRLLDFRGSGDEPFHGPEEIALARQELTCDDQPDEAMIGLARLEDLGGEYSTDPKAVIPLHLHDPYDDPAPLTFDVDGDQLAEFCDAYDVEVHDLGKLNGETVPIRWSQGHPYADWLSLAPVEEQA